MTILIRLSPISLMSACRECSSLETVVVNGLTHCASCGVSINKFQEIDYSNPYSQPEEKKTVDDWANVSPRLRKILMFEKRDKNKKSRPHKEGLIEIENYQNKLFSGKKDFSINEKYPLIQQAISLFEKGIKMQTREIRKTNQKSMFMPSGLKNAPLFAAYASLLYAERIISEDWNSGLKKLSEHIYENIRPSNQSRKELSLNEIQSHVRVSYKRLRYLVPMKRSQKDSIHKSTELKNNFSEIVSQYTQSIEGKISSDLLSKINLLEYEINSELNREKLEVIIPQSGLILISIEMLYQLIKSTNSKISRNEIQQILNQKKRISDKQKVVKEIFRIIDFKI